MSEQTPTPETDAAIRALCEAHDGDLAADFNALGNFARKLERERDEAKRAAAQADEIDNHFNDEIARHNETKAELTQLRKVCDELAKQLEYHSSGELTLNIALRDYSTLPHVIKAKETK